MIIFAKADGTVIDVITTPVYQGSNLSGSIYFVAPLPPLNAVTVTFKLPNGINTQNYRMTSVNELVGVTDKFGKEYSVWEWQDKNAEVTQYAGVCLAQFSIYLPNGQLLTTSRTSFEVEAGVLAELSPEPAPDVYDLILRYLAQLDARTQNVPNLVASIQKVEGADNAFTYTDNSGVTSAPIVLGAGGETPTLSNNASAITVPETAWVPQYEGVNITSYTYVITAGLHGQMRDGATAADLWVSFDEGAENLGAYSRYTADASGNITVYVNEPVAMTVRVWNGKGGYDGVAREEIQNLQSQVDEIEQSGVDKNAREAIAAETARAEAAEEELHNEVVAETTRAEQAEEGLHNEIVAETARAIQAEVSLSNLITRATFRGNAVFWRATPAEFSYLGSLYTLVDLPENKHIIQVCRTTSTTNDDGTVTTIYSPRGAWRGNVIYANEPFNGVAIIV